LLLRFALLSHLPQHLTSLFLLSLLARPPVG
jgi:hypothetical protein